MITYNDVVAATPNVLRRLKDLTVLPEHGTVAGQAVASLFYEELNIGVSGPINDVDIFVSLSLPPEQRAVVYTGNIKNVRTNRTASNITGMVAESDDYSRIKFICARSNVTILRTYQDGLRNFTLINHDECGSAGEQTVDVSYDIVRGFDLNLVGVGIHLESGTPVVTQDFIEFLNHKTMKVVTCNTPTHTLIRLAKKAYSGEMVGVHCDFDFQRSMLETHLKLVNRNSGHFITVGKTVIGIGEKYRALATTYAQYLPPLKRETYSGLYMFNANSLRTEPSLDVIENMFKVNSTAHRVDFLMRYIFVANFPRVYELANDPNSQRWDMLSHAWDANNEMDDGLRLNNVSTALFDTPLADPQLDLQGAEASTFVFNSTLNAAQREYATHLYNGFTRCEKMILHHTFSHIKHTQQFANNKDAYIEQFLRKEGLFGVVKISEQAPSEQVQDLLGKMRMLMRKERKCKRLIVDQLKSDWFIVQSPELFKHYEDKHALLETLAQLDGVKIDQLNTKEIYILSLAYVNGLWHPTWNNAQSLVEKFFSQGYWLFEDRWGEDPHQVSFINKTLNMLHDDQLFKHESILVRSILVPQHYDIIRDRLMKSDRNTMLKKISEVSQYLNVEADPEERMGADLWGKLVLDLNTIELGAAKSKRKM